MDAANRVAKNTLILYARMGITVFMSLYSTRLVLAALGADDFGIFNVVGGAVVMLTFLNNAMAAASQRFMSYAQGEGDNNSLIRIFNASVLLHFIIGLGFILVLELLGGVLFDSILNIDQNRIGAAKLIYHFLVASTFIRVISVPYDAVLNAHENMTFVAILGILEAILKLGIALFITYTSFDKLATYGFLMAGLTMLLLIITRIYCHKHYNEVYINLRKYFDKSIFKNMTGFGGWSLLGVSSSMLSFYGQGIVINIFFGTAVNAAQGVANQVSGQLNAFASTMMKALNPTIAKSEGAGNRKLMIQASLIGSKISFFLLMLFYVPVLIEMPFIFNLWLKNVPEFAVIFCRLLLLRNLVDQLFYTLTTSISAVGIIKNFQITRSIFNFLPILVAYIFFSLKYPPFSMYVIFLVFSIINSGIILYFSKKLIDLSIMYFFRDVLIKVSIPFGISICCSYIPRLMLDSGLLRLLSVVSISLVTFALSVWFIGLSKNERDIISSTIIILGVKIRGYKWK